MHRVWHVAYRTGLNTTMGSLVRELLAPSKRAAGQDPFVTVRIYLLSACCQPPARCTYDAKCAVCLQA